MGACSIDYKLLAQVVNERHKVYNICFVDFEKAFGIRVAVGYRRQSVSFYDLQPVIMTVISVSAMKVIYSQQEKRDVQIFRQVFCQN